MSAQWKNNPAKPTTVGPCAKCDGTGERGTGIEESPTTMCGACEGTGLAVAASPVQGAASATDQGAAVKPWQERVPSDYLANWMKYEPNPCETAMLGELADRAALAAPGEQAAKPSKAEWPDMVPLSKDGTHIWLEGVGAVELLYPAATRPAEVDVERKLRDWIGRLEGNAETIGRLDGKYQGAPISEGDYRTITALRDTNRWLREQIQGAARTQADARKDAERFSQAIALEDNAETLYAAVMNNAPNKDAIRAEFDAATTTKPENT